MDGRVEAREYRSQGAIRWQDPRARANDHTPVSAVMSRRIVSVPPETSVEGVTALLLGHGLSAALVIAEDGGLCGVVSTSDLPREVRIARATVQEIMTPFAFTIPATASIERAAAFMAFEGILQLPVTAAPGDRVVGVLGAFDIMRWLGRSVPEADAR